VPLKRKIRSENDEEESFQIDTDSQPDKYYKKFDFFYKRTCFRLMAEFFKQLFNPYHKIWVDSRKKSNMNDHIQEFAYKYFGDVLSKLPEHYQVEFITILVVLVNSHRHNKEDKFIRDTRVDFTIVRDTMYKYSKKA